MAEGLGDFRSTVGFEFTDRGDHSTESREFCKGDGDSDFGLDTSLLVLLTLGVAIDPLLEFSDRLGLSNSKWQHQINNNAFNETYSTRYQLPNKQWMDLSHKKQL